MDSAVKFLSLAFHRVGTIVFLPAITFLVTIDVILRYVFNSPIWGSKEINGLFLSMVLFLSLSYCLDEKRHVQVELIYGRLRGKMRALADMIIAISCMLFAGLMGLHYISDLPYVFRTGESGEELGIPFWPIKIIICLCSSLLFFNGFLQLLHAVKRFLRRGPSWN
jgi:TRAP-type transport system small permease protein